MIQTISPYASARTAEIMSRYRPIAPKPEAPSPNSAAENDNSALPNGIRKSPYLRNVWAHLQARPTRTRKRGRTAAFPPPRSSGLEPVFRASPRLIRFFSPESCPAQVRPRHRGHYPGGSRLLFPLLCSPPPPPPPFSLLSSTGGKEMEKLLQQRNRF
ncbi:UNVERIFIED_CONTAM: hypothetical protein Sangu_1918100 [Sesamum angustifolium]|uniref:Uncharacterized protein n=1 Tax=Sesamum angustifolium TaxID=2727405 RepID=A0AAW2LXF2_9LAMI